MDRDIISKFMTGTLIEKIYLGSPSGSGDCASEHCGKRFKFVGAREIFVYIKIRVKVKHFGAISFGFFFVFKPSKLKISKKFIKEKLKIRQFCDNKSIVYTL